MENNVPGGWTVYRTEISDKEMEIFKQAFEGFLGVSYAPLTVATQVVEGTNYRFFCNAKASYPNAPNEGALIQILQPLEGKAFIRFIKPCE